MSQTLRQGLPPIYSPLFAKEFDRPAVVESRATCASCQMCDHGNAPPELVANFFRPDTKCCTYYPSLPNFLVGAILADPSPEMAEGKRRIQEKIKDRIGVTPNWCGPSRKWDLLYRASSATSFGRSKTLTCPYLTEDSRCSVWRHRETVCSTFYCKFDGGIAGSAFWKALKQYLSLVETRLAMFASKAVDADVREPEDPPNDQLTLADLEDRVNEPLYARAWGSWAGREEEFYVACYEKVKGLSRAEFLQNVDDSPRGKPVFAALFEAYDAIGKAQVIPERMALNAKARVLPVLNGVVVTTPYNANDSFQLETELFDVLKAFRHEDTVREVRKRLADEQGIEFEDALLETFIAHGILVAPPKAGICAPVTPTTNEDGEPEPMLARTSTGRWVSKR